MKVVYTDTARRHIASQIGYLVDQGAVGPARRLRSRIAPFVKNFIARHPRASRHIPEHDIYETWIPRTPYVILYRVDVPSDTLTILALFHTSQDRSHFAP